MLAEPGPVPIIVQGSNISTALRLRFCASEIARRPGKGFFPAVEPASRLPHSAGTPRNAPMRVAHFSSRLAAAFSSLPGGQGRFAPSATTRFPFVGTADRPLLSARPRLTTPGARERPLPERNTHSFPSAGDNGAALPPMQIEFTVQEPPYRTGTLTGLTHFEVQRLLPGIQPDTRTSANHKVTLMWRFLVDGKLCGVWN